MRKYFLVLTLFAYADAMEQKSDDVLCPVIMPHDEDDSWLQWVDVYALLHQHILVDDLPERKIVHEPSAIFSKNHTSFDETEGDAGSRCFNIVGRRNNENRLLTFAYKRVDQDGNQIVDEVQYDIGDKDGCQFDGHNDKGLMVVGSNVESIRLFADNVTSCYRSQYCLLTKKNVIKEIHDCWCNPKKKLRFLRVDFRSPTQQAMVTAVAVHKKMNRFVVARTKESNVQTVEVYDAEDIEQPKLIARADFGQSAGEALKKISFLTHKTLAAISVGGQFMTFAIDEEKQTVEGSIQTIKGSKNAVFNVQDMAVDSYNPFQMVLWLEDGRLVYGDLKTRTYVPLADIAILNDLWYSNDTVGYTNQVNENDCTLNLFKVLPVKLSWVPLLWNRAEAEKIK